MRKLLQNSRSNAIRRNEREFLHSLGQEQPLECIYKTGGFTLPVYAEQQTSLVAGDKSDPSRQYDAPPSGASHNSTTVRAGICLSLQVPTI